MFSYSFTRERGKWFLITLKYFLKHFIDSIFLSQGRRSLIKRHILLTWHVDCVILNVSVNHKFMISSLISSNSAFKFCSLFNGLFIIWKQISRFEIFNAFDFICLMTSLWRGGSNWAVECYQYLTHISNMTVSNINT